MKIAAHLCGLYVTFAASEFRETERNDEATDLSRPTRRFRARCLLFTMTATHTRLCETHLTDAKLSLSLSLSSSSDIYLNGLVCAWLRESRTTATMLHGRIEKRRKSVISEPAGDIRVSAVCGFTTLYRISSMRDASVQKTTSPQ